MVAVLDLPVGSALGGINTLMKTHHRVKGRTRYRILYRFLVMEVLRWFGVSFAFFFAIFLVNNILLLAEDILSKSVTLRYVLLLLLFTIPTVLSYTFPFSTLLATLIAAVRHASHLEFLAIQSLGISMVRCYIPVGILGMLFAGGSFVTNEYLVPRAAVGFVRLYQEILFSAPALELESYSIRQYLDNIVVTGKVEGNTIERPLIIEPNTEESTRRVVSAERATILANLESGVLSLSLHNVNGHSRPIDISEHYDYFTAERMNYNILLRALNVALRPLTPRELQLQEVRSYLQEREPEVQQVKFTHQRNVALTEVQLGHYYLELANQIQQNVQINPSDSQVARQLDTLNAISQEDIIDSEYLVYETEYYRKFSLPVACFFLTLFAFPVGIRLRRANWGMGFGIGLAASVLYWCLLIGGQAYIFQQSNLSAVVVMWAPNVVLGMLGIIIYLLRLRTQ